MLLDHEEFEATVALLQRHRFNRPEQLKAAYPSRLEGSRELASMGDVQLRYDLKSLVGYLPRGARRPHPLVGWLTTVANMLQTERRAMPGDEGAPHSADVDALRALARDVAVRVERAAQADEGPSRPTPAADARPPDEGPALQALARRIVLEGRKPRAERSLTVPVGAPLSRATADAIGLMPPNGTHLALDPLMLRDYRTLQAVDSTLALLDELDTSIAHFEVQALRHPDRALQGVIAERRAKRAVGLVQLQQQIRALARP